MEVTPAGTVNVYYEAAAVIVALILLGRFLEARAKGRTSEAIKRLVGLPGDTITYTVTVANAGPSAVAGAVVENAPDSTT